MSAPIAERLNTMPIHTRAAVLAANATRPGAAPLLIAFTYKTLVDGFSGGLLRGWGAWAMVVAYLPFGTAGLLGLRAMRRRWGRGDSRAGDSSWAPPLNAAKRRLRTSDGGLRAGPGRRRAVSAGAPLVVGPTSRWLGA